jgi:hypothetical protein
MSAPAPALAKQERTVVVRLGDAAAAVSCLSVAFILALVLFPTAFPQVIMDAWHRGRLTPAMMMLALVVDAALYIRVARLLSTKPRLLIAGGLGLVPIFIVFGLSMLFESTASRALVGYATNASARVGEELLAQAYFTIVAAIFLPFLAIRLVAQFKARR